MHSYYACLYYVTRIKPVAKIRQSVSLYLDVIGVLGLRFIRRNNLTFLYIPSLIACRTNCAILFALVVFHYFVHSVAIRGAVRHLSYAHALSENMWSNIKLIEGKVAGKDSRKHGEIRKE